MIEFIPYVFQISLSLAIGLVAIFLFKKSGKLGLAFIGLAFFLVAVPSVVNLALGGPYLALQLMDQGYTVAEVGAFYFYLFLLSGAFQAVFTIIVLAGLIKLSR